MTSLVNTETGEILDSKALAPMSAGNEVAVTSYLSQARDWLARAVDETGPEQIAAAKAEIATAAEATKQLGLSKEIQEDAAEMVRRAEWALRRAVRKSQDEGEVATRGANLVPGNRSGSPVDQSSRSLPSPKDFFASVTEYEDSNAMAALTEDQFEAVLSEAKAEGNLSRSNVARKARELSGRGRVVPRPAAEKTLFNVDTYAGKAAREAQSLTPDQIRRVRAEGRDLTTLRRSIEALERLMNALTPEEQK